MNDSSIYETYEKEYKTLYETISKKVGLLKNSGSFDLLAEKKLLQNQIARELEEADEIVLFINELGQLEMEVVSLPPQKRNQNNITLRSYKESLKKLKKEMVVIFDKTLAVSTERDQLLGTNNTVVDIPLGQDQRSQLLQGTARLENASKRLEDAHRIALETESIGIGTLGDLHRQRNQIERTRDGVVLID